MSLSQTLRVTLTLACLGSASLVQAGTCELMITRTACPGQEETSYKKCNGEAACSEFLELDSAAACQAEAVKACENKRLSITKSKVISAKFDDAAVKSASGGADFCADYPNRAAEFDKCDSQ